MYLILSLLLIPFVFTQLSNEVNWNFIDFLIMGILLVVISFLVDLISRKVKGKKKKITLIILTLLAFLFVWAEIAVGVVSDLL